MAIAFIPPSQTMSDERSTISIGQLRVGTVVSAAIFDATMSSTKLVGKGVEITDELLAHLRSRRVDNVVVSKSDLAMMNAGLPQGVRRQAPDHQYPVSNTKTDRSCALDHEIDRGNFATNVEPAESEKVVRYGLDRTDRYDAHHVKQAVRQHEHHVESVDFLFDRMADGSAAKEDVLGDVCSSSIQSAVDDKDLFLCLGLNPFNAGYPARHSLHVSTVAISIGVVLGLNDDSLKDLGTGCLIHDVGMLKMDKPLHQAKRRLSPRELATLADHPILTLDALACPGIHLSRVARIIAFQLHERCNGTGYPRARSGDEIHSLAKIAAVADAYVGLVSNRAHRRGLMPYFAVKKILESVPSGLYDPKAVRGLLNAISLFPIGSFVQTNDGRIGRVVRATDSYMKPIVELWDAKHEVFEPDLLNLNNESNISIVKAVGTPQNVAA